jgi:hypothetical protein
MWGAYLIGAIVHFRDLVIPNSSFEYSSGPFTNIDPIPSELYVLS